jgi:perosamine synthetase
MKLASAIKDSDSHLSDSTRKAQLRLPKPASSDQTSALRVSLAESGEVLQHEDHSRDLLQRINGSSITFWRGRVALYAILRALGIGNADSVVVPGYTCFAVPSAVCFAGAEPVYADIEPATFNLSLPTIQSALRRNPGANVKAIIIQHTYGIPADTQPIVSWARERGIATVEDCAHVHGSRYLDGSNKWLPAGSLADASFFSSQWTKAVSTGLGGWVNAQDLNLWAEIQRFRSEHCVRPSKGEVAMLAAQVGIRTLLSHPRIDGMLKLVYQAMYGRGLVVGTSSRGELHAQMPSGYAKRMSSFQERLLRRSSSDEFAVAHRRRLQRVYDEALELTGLPVLNAPEKCDPVLLRYPVRIKQKERALAEAKRSGLEIGDWYTHPIDGPESLDAGKLGYRPGTCPEGELAGREVVNLPMGLRVTDKSARQMVEFLKKFN